MRCIDVEKVFERMSKDGWCPPTATALPLKKDFGTPCGSSAVRVSQSHVDAKGVGMAVVVTGFGCRPITNFSTRTTGGRRSKAARERSRGRVCTRRFSGLYGELAGAVGAAGCQLVEHRCRVRPASGDPRPNRHRGRPDRGPSKCFSTPAWCTQAEQGRCRPLTSSTIEQP